jgi:hypothetical protein
MGEKIKNTVIKITNPKKLSGELDLSIPKTIPIKKPCTVKKETKFEPRIHYHPTIFLT